MFLHPDREDSDQPGRMPRLWADAQADLSLRWAHRSFCWFCHAAICSNKKISVTVALIIEPHHAKMCLWGFSTR